MNDERPPKGAPDTASSTVANPIGPANPQAERACRSANVAGAIALDRAPYVSSVARMDALRTAGRLYDELFFAQLADAS